MSAATSSTLKFTSSTGQVKAKPAKRSKPKNGPVVITRVDPSVMARPRPALSPATAEALARTGRLPKVGR